jgi:transposase-like protein
MSPAQYRARIQIARRVIQAGGCFVDLADEVGVSKAAIGNWFDNHPELSDIRDQLASNSRTGRQIVGPESRRVLLLVKVAHKEITLREAAEMLGVSSSALIQWRRRNWIVLHDALHEKKAA